jgi:glycosyltransferase involved in cell wall biosynthesis
MKLVVEGTQAYRNYRGWGRYNELLLLGLHQRSSEKITTSVFYHEDASAMELSKRFEPSSSFKIFPVKRSEEEFKKLEEDFHNSYIDREFSGCDIYHAVTEFPFYSKKAALVITIHELTPLIFKEYFPPSFVNEFIHYLSYAARNAQRLICPSLNTKLDLVKNFNIDENRVAVIPNCIKPVFTADVTNIQSQDYLLYVGGLDKPSKNFECFFEAYRKCISDIDSEVELIVVNGEYDQQSFEKKFSVDSSSNYRVTLLNTVTDKKLVNLYRNATALIYPSYYEGFGLPIIEALSCGCPVLCDRNLPAVKEFLDDEILKVNVKNVEIFAQAIQNVIRSKEKNKLQAIDNSKRIQKNFSLNSFIDAHVDVYKSV